MRDPYVWIDPFTLHEECEYAIQREYEEHREAMSRMADAHAHSMARVYAQTGGLQQAALDLMNRHMPQPIIVMEPRP